MKIHVCIISDALLANYLPALIDRPNLVYLVTTRDMQPAARQLARLLKIDGMRSTVWTDHSDGRWPGVADTALKLAQRITEHGPGVEVTLNVTGGLKTMALGFMRGFEGTPHQTIYVDMRNHVINRVELPAVPDVPITDVLDLKRHLLANGFEIQRQESREARWMQAAEARRALSELLAARWTRIGYLADAINDAAAAARNLYERKKRPYEQAVEVKLDNKQLAVEHGALMRRLVEFGVVEWDADRAGVLRFPSYAQARYLGGTWLEEYAFLQLKDLGLRDLAGGVSGAWQSEPEPARNEFDVVATHRNRLLFIECKAGAFRKDDRIQDTFGKIDALGHRAAGRFGAVVLLTPRMLPAAAVSRARAGRIVPVHGKDALRLREMVRAWMESGTLE